MFKYKVIVLSRKFQLYTYNWNWWRKIHSCMPLNFFSVYLLKKTVFEEIKISGSFSSCVTFESWLLQRSFISKKHYCSTQHKNKNEKNNWLFFRFEQHRKKSIPTINSDWTDCTLLWCFFVKIHAHHFQLV